MAEIERRLEAYDDPIEVAVLGCAVNGIGEASHADFGIAGAKDMGVIYSKGEPLQARSRPSSWSTRCSTRSTSTTPPASRSSRRGAAPPRAREWLAENEDETAMTPERLAAMEAAAARLDEDVSPVAGRRFTRA